MQGMDSEKMEVVNLIVTISPNKTVLYERKILKETTIAELKVSLALLTGINAMGMQLELYNDERFVTQIRDYGENGKLNILEDFPVQDGMRLHVIGRCPWFENDATAKFELSQEEYNRRPDSLRHFLRQNRLGRYKEDFNARKQEEQDRQKKEEQTRLSLAVVGARCRISTKHLPPRFAQIMYKGQLEGKSGTFFGVKFDEPVGVNDGVVDGKRYFECGHNYGSFVTIKVLEIGDFPPDHSSDEL